MSDSVPKPAALDRSGNRSHGGHVGNDHDVKIVPRPALLRAAWVRVGGIPSAILSNGEKSVAKWWENQMDGRRLRLQRILVKEGLVACTVA